MNALWLTAMLMGAAGSAHCIGMCGPIALAVPGMGGSRRSRLVSTVLLNAGRLTSYASLGVAFGAMGSGLRLAGLQDAVALTTGVLLVLAVLSPRMMKHTGVEGRLAIGLSRLRGSLARNLRRTSPEAIFFSGMLNGLLPCGLVYTAGLGAAAIGTAWGGGLFMLLFGAGTLPVLIAFRSGSAFMPPAFRARLRRLSPVVVGIMGIMLVLRGARLDIPYISPSSVASAASVVSCH